MAISPLDLQTLFTQMDKVSKQDAAQREGAAIMQSIQNAKIQEHIDERVRTVNESQNTGEGTDAIDDESGGRPGQGRNHGESSAKAEEKDKEGEAVIRDPDLGRNIDVSL